MSKKKKPVKSSINPSKQNLSKWQHRQNISRIAMIASAIFLAVIAGIIVFGLYNSEIKPLHQPAIEVNNNTFDMAYYIEMLDAYTRNLQTESVDYMADSVTNQIVRNELIKQGAGALAVVVSSEEVESALAKTENASEEIYTDIVESELLSNKVLEYFNAKLPYEIEQIHINVMLVESEMAADTVISRIDSREEFSVLMAEFSIESEGNKDKLWLPEELITNLLVAEQVSTLKPGEIDKVADEAVKKDKGYWLIEVTGRDEIKGTKIRAMLLGSRGQADEIKERLDTEEFNALAVEYSQHESKENGGELGWLKMGEIGNDTFDGVAFDISLDVVSNPVPDSSVETIGGYWVIELLAREEHELTAEARTKLAQEDFIEWLSEQENSSTIVIHLDSESKSWAVKKVLRGRK